MTWIELELSELPKKTVVTGMAGQLVPAELLHGNAERRHRGLVQLACNLQAVSLLEVLQRRLAVGAPYAVHGAGIGPVLAKPLLHQLHGLRSHGLGKGQH